MTDNLKSNFDDCMQLINSIDVNASHKTCENLPYVYTSNDKTATVENDAEYKNADTKVKNYISKIDLAVSNTAIFECNDDTGNPSKADITTTENSIHSLRDNEVKQTVVNSSVAIDSLQQVFLKSDCNIESIDDSASDITEIPTGAEETPEKIISDSKQEIDILNNFEIFSNVEGKSQSELNVDVKCPALFDENTAMIRETVDSLKNYTEKETNGCSNTAIKCLQQAELGSADMVENKKNNTNDVMVLNSVSMQISEEIAHVNSQDGCSQPIELEIYNNNSKQEADLLNNLTVFDKENKNFDSNLNPNLTESLHMDIQSEVNEVISELKDNCLIEKDVVTNKISECQNKDTTTGNSVHSLRDNEVKQTVVNSNVEAIDSLQQVLLKSDCNIESFEDSSDITEIPTGSGETSEKIICDFKQETNILNNFATLSNVEEKSQSKLNVDVKCPALFDEKTAMIRETADSLKNYTEKETNGCSNTAIKCLQQHGLGSADEVENKKNDPNNVMVLNSVSMQISEETAHVNSQDVCSQTIDLEIDTENVLKQEADLLNNLTVFDEKKKYSESKLSSNLTENLHMDIQCEVNEVISELKDNCLIEKDVVTNKISKCQNKENNQVTVSEASLDAPITSQTTNLSYRGVEETWTDDDDSSSSSSSGSSSDSDFFQMIVESSSAPKTAPEIKTRGELGLDDLPPIEDLTITIPKEDMMLIGVIHAVVDKLVVIHALKDMKPLDIDSVLFLTHERPLGRVYDVFGPVVEPFYCVRFNNTEDIKEKLVEIGAYVFFAPKKDDITSYVFVDELQKERGSDASWKFNNEPPEEFLDFSDDEQEKTARRNKMIKKRNQRFSDSSDLAAKRASLMSDSDSQQNLNYRPAHHQSTSYRSNVNVSRAPAFAPFSRPYPSRPPPSSSPFVSNVFGVSRFSRPYPSRPPPSPSPIVSNVFGVSRFSRPYPSRPPPSPSPIVSTVIGVSRFSSPYPPHPPSSPTPSVSSIFEAPRFNPFSSSYPSHPPSSPSHSVSSVLEAPRFIPYSSPFPHPPPSPSPTVSVIAAPSFSPVPNPYFPSPPSPTPSVCSVMSVAVRARTQHNFSTPQQPHPPYPQQPRAPFVQHPKSFAPQRYSFPPQNTIQPALPPQQHFQQPNSIPAFPQSMPQRPALSPALPYQQTHVFGQVTLMSPITTLQPPLPPPLPPVNIQRFTPPPPVSMQSFIHQPSPFHSHVPPQYPLTVQIPNLNNPSVPVIQNGQPPLY